MALCNLQLEAPLGLPHLEITAVQVVTARAGSWAATTQSAPSRALTATRHSTYIDPIIHVVSVLI